MKARVTPALALSIAAIGVVAGCSSGSDTASTTTTSTVVVSSTAAAPPGSTEDPGGGSGRAGGTTAPAGGPAAACRAGQLSGAVTADPDGGTAGATHSTITLINTGSSTCTLTGYPGVSFVGDGNGTQLGAAARRDGSTATTVTVDPGRSASAALRIAQAGAVGGCDPVRADGLRIYPPDDRAAVFVRTTAYTACRSTTAQPLLTVGTLR